MKNPLFFFKICQPNRREGVGWNIQALWVVSCWWNLVGSAGSKSNLWVEVLRSKCMVCEDIIPALYARPNSSPLWKALCFSLALCFGRCSLGSISGWFLDRWSLGSSDNLFTWSMLVLGTLLLIRVNGGEAYLTACFRRLFSDWWWWVDMVAFFEWLFLYWIYLLISVNGIILRRYGL